MSRKVGAKEFAGAAVAGMGKKPEKLKAVSHAGAASPRREWTPNLARKAITHAAGYDIVKTETLRTSDGQQGFTLAQGQ